MYPQSKAKGSADYAGLQRLARIMGNVFSFPFLSAKSIRPNGQFSVRG
jgi:hypothetical protein